MKVTLNDAYTGAEYFSETFRQTPIGMVVAGMVNRDDKGLINGDIEVQTIHGMISSTLELVADAVQDGGEVDAVRATNVADCLRLMAALSRFCTESLTAIQDAQFRAEQEG